MSRQQILLVMCSAVFIVACNQAPQPADTAALPGTAWNVVSIDDVIVESDLAVSVEFSAEGGVAGSGGCNRYFGSAEMDGSKLSFSELGSSRKWCGGETMDLERRFLAALGEASRIEIDTDDHLVFLDANGNPRIRATEIDQ